ncbi:MULTISPECIES: hypothetical protein [Flavobacterium]|uniref:Cytochrome c domain-containing protein n=1 Tax=Flavobacterium hankyongi TaxID=1176532 RepID=A0ABP9A1U9_9FLAO|nr:hypothetical protein [Flavobacterium sp. N1846]
MQKKLIYITSILLFYGCSNESTDDLTDPVPEKVSYSRDVKPITDTNCIPCHNNPPLNGAPMSLLTKLQVQDAIINRGLLDRISRPQGASGMMPNGGTRLPQSSIDIIKKWQTDNFSE